VCQGGQWPADRCRHAGIPSAAAPDQLVQPQPHLYLWDRKRMANSRKMKLMPITNSCQLQGRGREGKGVAGHGRGRVRPAG